MPPLPACLSFSFSLPFQLSSHQMSSVAADIRLKDAAFFKGHKLPVTCVALPGEGSCDPSNSSSSSSGCAYTGGKDCCVIRWDLETGKKVIFKGQRNCFVVAGDRNSNSKSNGISANSSRGHFRAVLSVCVADDERLFFSGGADHTIKAWDPRASNERYAAVVSGILGVRIPKRWFIVHIRCCSCT